MTKINNQILNQVKDQVLRQVSNLRTLNRVKAMQVITYVSTPWSRSINFERANIEWYPILPWDHLAAARWCEIDLLHCFFSLFWVFSILFDAFCYAFRGLSSDFKGLGGNLNPCRFRNLLMVKSLEISAKLLKTLANQRHFFLAAAIFSLTLPRAWAILST